MCVYIFYHIHKTYTLTIKLFLKPLSCIYTSSDFCHCMSPGAGNEVFSRWQRISFLAAKYKHFGGKRLNIALVYIALANSALD